ncbi:hypothetical protein [Nonomuraea sp. NEAU-A123]|uniref:hypothetical protein n=1 Tax=Nonomuraea sp. NEAU-A123 TaxID=2839649 RepID=UPI001BE43A56|nr:hypothetical protein [Nonomuraea sp. NEAU-A123]MBT2226243.1 hypothetical protein [Nonomuraea sp. NEAU-A123]
MSELATAEVRLEVDFDNLDEDVKKGLEARVRKAAKVAQAELTATEKAAAALGDTIEKRVGGGADKAGAKLKRVTVAAKVELGKAARAAGDTADAVERLASAAGDTLFDIDESGVVKLNHAVENVQQSLFDLDTVEIERITTESDKAAASLRGRLVGAAGRARAALARIFLNNPDAAGTAAGVEDLGEKVTDLGRRADKSRGQLDRYSGRLAILASAIAAGAAAAPPLIAAGAGIGAAVALSVPSIVAVVKGTKELSDRWDGLTKNQRSAVASTRTLIDRYKALSKAVEPESLRLYNATAAETIRLLPRLQPLAETTAKALQRSTQTIGQGFDSPRAREFFTFLQSSAGPAVDSLTDLVVEFGAASASSVQALAPLAGSVLGLVGGLLRLLTLLNDVSPELAQLVVLGVALRSPLSAVGTLLSKGASSASKFAGSAGKAAGAGRLLNLVAGAGPNLYLAAGVAIAFFAIRALNAKSALDSTINSINGVNQAFGNNIKGYKAANTALAAKLIPTQQRLAASTKTVGRETTFANLQLAQGALAADNFVRAPITAAMDANRAAIKRVTSAAQQLVNAGFAPSVASATRLATAAGVDLSKALDENGTISASAAARIATYSASVATAGDSTIVLADAWHRAKDEAIGLEAQTAALQEVFNRFLNPSLAVLDATNHLTEVQKEITKAFKDGNVTALARQQLLSKEVTALRDKLVAEQRATGSTAQTTAETLKLLPALSRLAGNSKAGRDAVFNLARSLDGAREDASGAITVVDKFGRAVRVLPNGKIVRLKAVADTSPARGAIDRLIKDSTGRVIDVFVQVKGSRVQAHAGATGGMLDPARGFIRRAAGGPSGRVRGPGTGTSDSIPALLSNGEYVINAKQTRKYLGLLHALNAGRFAAGGLVGAIRGYASGGRVSGQGAINLRLGLELPKSVEKALAKRIQAIGLTLGAQLSRSLVGSPSEISTAIRSLEKKIKTAFVGIRTTIDDRLIKRLEVVNDRLTAAAKKRDQLADTIAEARQFRTSTIERTRGFAELTGFDDEEKSSAAKLVATLRDRLAKIKTFARDVQVLTRRGLDKGIIRQLVEGGPEQAGELARTLATGSRTALAEITSLQQRIDRQSSAFGTSVTDTLFDAGAAAGKGFLTGLKSQRAEIVALMTEIAKSVSTTVRKTLKIKSPSRVLRADAVDTLRGYIDGLRATAARVRATMIDAVRPTDAVRRAARLTPAAGSVGAGAAATERLTRQTTIHAPITLISPDPSRAGDSVLARLDRLADATR